MLPPAWHYQGLGENVKEPARISLRNEKRESGNMKRKKRSKLPKDDMLF
jgi:hypothetical protein